MNNFKRNEQHNKMSNDTIKANEIVLCTTYEQYRVHVWLN